MLTQSRKLTSPIKELQKKIKSSSRFLAKKQISLPPKKPNKRKPKQTKG